MSILGPLGSGLKQHITGVDSRNEQAVCCLRKTLTFLGMFHLGGFYSHLFYYLDIVYNPGNVGFFFF